MMESFGSESSDRRCSLDWKSSLLQSAASAELYMSLEVVRHLSAGETSSSSCVRSNTTRDQCAHSEKLQLLYGTRRLQLSAKV